MIPQTSEQTHHQSNGQMTWRPPGVAEPLLHLRLLDTDPWRPYTEFPEYMKPDPPHFSAGYTTFIALLKNHWQNIIL